MKILEKLNFQTAETWLSHTSECFNHNINGTQVYLV